MSACLYTHTHTHTHTHARTHARAQHLQLGKQASPLPALENSLTLDDLDVEETGGETLGVFHADASAEVTSGITAGLTGDAPTTGDVKGAGQAEPAVAEGQGQDEAVLVETLSSLDKL
jgi:hypothetical protein